MNQLFICLLFLNAVKMRVPGKRGNDEGLLSIDFIIGFTFFMVALIFVAVMISGLLVHLQSRTIDYDAVAYRTSVILVEDPGEPANWNLNDLSIPAERDSVRRLGLAIDKNYPAVLKLSKVEKFFNNSTPMGGCYSLDTFCKPDDYRSRLIFGDYPYQFNISMKGLGSEPWNWNYTVGDQIPPNSSYGFIKRIVKVQIPNSTYVFELTNLTNETDPNNQNETIIRIDFSDLYGVPAPYRIDPLNEELNITINFTNLTPTLAQAQICTYPLVGVPGCVLENAYEDHPRMNVIIDGSETIPNVTSDNVTIIIDNGYFHRVGFDRFDAVDVRLTFDRNVTNQSLFNYNYTTVNPLPRLEPAVIEVRVW